jgi:hypothetical protein
MGHAQRIEHPTGTPAHTILGVRESAHQLHPQFWAFHATGQAAVVPELPPVALVDRIQHDHSKSFDLFRRQWQTFDQSDETGLGIARTEEPRISFEECNSTFESGWVAGAQALAVFPETRRICGIESRVESIDGGKPRCSRRIVPIVAPRDRAKSV